MNLNDFRLNAYKNGGRFNSQSKIGQPPVDIPGDAAGAAVSVEPTVIAKALTSGGLLKVPEQQKDSGARDSVYRRVAKFLLLIGVDEASKILPHLTEEQTEKIIPEIASIHHVDPAEAEEILNEFQSLMHRAREDGGVDTARTILQKAFGTVQAEKMMAVNSAANTSISIGITHHII